MDHLTHKTYQRARDLILASEGKYCRCPDPNHVKGNDNSPISLDRVLMALGVTNEFEEYGGYILGASGDLVWWDLTKRPTEENPINIICSLKLGQPLHLQSLDTIEKIVEILEGNKK